MDLHRAMQNDIHRLTRLFNGQHISPRLKHAAMRALCNPIQLGWRQPREQPNIREQIASIVFSPWRVSHCAHILHPLHLYYLTVTWLLFSFQRAKQFQVLRMRLAPYRTVPSRKLPCQRPSRQSRLDHNGTGSTVPPLKRRPFRKPSSQSSVHILAWMGTPPIVRDNVPPNIVHRGLTYPQRARMPPTFDPCLRSPLYRSRIQQICRAM